METINAFIQNVRWQNQICPQRASEKSLGNQFLCLVELNKIPFVIALSQLIFYPKIKRNSSCCRISRKSIITMCSWIYQDSGINFPVTCTCLIVPTEKYFRNLNKSNRNQIVITMYRLICNRKMKNTIWFRFDLIRFRKVFSVYYSVNSCPHRLLLTVYY